MEVSSADLLFHWEGTRGKKCSQITYYGQVEVNVNIKF